MEVIATKTITFITLKGKVVFEKDKEYSAKRLNTHIVIVKHNNGEDIGFVNDFEQYFKEV